jgi:LmbE family N-acetylglucosaminyl deacetylase
MAKTLVISPHLDDAVLSFGGQLATLARSGEQAVVYTVFAASPTEPYSPVASAFHAQWNLSGDPIEPRRKEDRRALAELDVVGVHGDYRDAIYRQDGNGNWLIDGEDPMDFAGDPEEPLVAHIASTVQRLVDEHRPDRLVTCAAVGNHVDHRRVRDAVLIAAAATETRLSLWDDFPYVTWTDAVPETPPLYRIDPPRAVEIDATAWGTKLAAVRCHESQLGMLEGDGVPIDQMYAEHCDTTRRNFSARGMFEVVRDVLPGGPGR